MDPQHRALLSTSMVPAGMLVAEGLGGGCCVTVGFGDKEWGEVLSSHPPLTGVAPVTSTSGAIASGRISFFHGMRGPCYALDTACSSALCALHVASRSVFARESASALSMSVNLYLTPGGHLATEGASMTSADGRCKTLDASANGYVRSESCTAVAVVSEWSAGSTALLGSSVNQDGRSSTLTAPNGPSQQQVIASSLSSAGVEGSAVCSLQMHGTGTPLGDPIETGAAGSVLCAGERASPLALEAVKSSVGHAEWSAGAAGILQSSMSLRASTYAGVLHLRSMNSYVSASFEAGPAAKSGVEAAPSGGRARMLHTRAGRRWVASSAPRTGALALGKGACDGHE